MSKMEKWLKDEKNCENFHLNLIVMAHGMTHGHRLILF